MCSIHSVLNFRDVGDTINSITGSQILKPGVLFRSARPDGASAADREMMSSQLGIRTIIDLRSYTEHAEQARKYGPKDNNQLRDSDCGWGVRMPGIEYHDVNLNGGAFSKALLWRLTWWNLFKLIVFMTLGYKLEAISILGKEVMCNRGLEGLASDTLDFSKAEIRQVFQILTSSSNYPLLVHCTQGKDRTGLVIILLLLLLHVPKEAITADYLASDEALEPEKDERLSEIRKIGLTDDFAKCPTNFVQHVTSYVNEKYGGAKGYLVGACDILPSRLDEVQKLLSLP